MDSNQLDILRRTTSWRLPVTRVMIGAFFRGPAVLSHFAPIDWSDDCSIGFRLLSKWFTTSTGPKSDPFNKALTEFFFGHAETPSNPQISSNETHRPKGYDNRKPTVALGQNMGLDCSGYERLPGFLERAVSFGRSLTKDACLLVVPAAFGRPSRIKVGQSFLRAVNRLRHSASNPNVDGHLPKAQLDLTFLLAHLSPPFAVRRGEILARPLTAKNKKIESIAAFANAMNVGRAHGVTPPPSKGEAGT